LSDTHRVEELAPGTLVGEYRVERKIGAGGMGVVYGAKHPVIGKRAAIKVLNSKYSADREAVQRFVLEAQAVNQVAHANIVDIFSFGALPDGRSYFVMEWLQGETLGERMARGPLSIGETIAILLPLCRALEAAHAARVVHRDLKPENVFLVADGESFLVKLLDFGIAKLLTPDGELNRTATGLVVGTPLFMSPEQARGEALDARTDLYSLGVLAYSMLAGETPFGREGSTVEVMNAHIAKPPPPLRAIRADLPVAIESVILELLAKSPDARPSLAEVRTRLASTDTSAANAVAPWPGTPTQTVRGLHNAPITSGTLRPERPRRSVGVILAAIALCGIGAVLWFVVNDRDEPSPASPPRRSLDPAGAPPVLPAPAPRPEAEIGSSAPEPAPEPAPVLKAGVLELAIDPSTASVQVDGIKTAIPNGRARVALDAGPHQLTVSAPGRKPVRRTFDVVTDQTTTLDIRLERRRAAPAAETDIDGIHNPFPQ
jgi:serine/threonine-protein kinase